MHPEQHAPLSWLTLERYALGELGAEQRREVEARLSASEIDRQRLASIEADQVRLLPLPVPLAPTRRRPGKHAWFGAVGVLAAAALAGWVWLDRAHLPPSTGVKGGDLALELVGEHHGVDALRFSQGERFKLLVTCPPELGGNLRAAVYQGGSLFRPLADGGPKACGNRVAWPGAFALDGKTRAWVCVRADAGAWPSSLAQLSEAVTCSALDPED